MSKRYSTDELVNIFNNHSVNRPYYFGFDVVNAIIVRLRAGDKLCGAARKMLNGYRDAPYELARDLRKAVAEHEGNNENVGK